MTDMNQAGAASALVASLERTWQAIAGRHPDLPAAVIVVAAGSGRRRNELKLGHFAAGRWDVAGKANPEVLVGGEGLRRGAHDVLGTLLHEAAHGLAHVRSIKDTSRGGRYHNRRYQQLADELGLEVRQDGPLGWSATGVTPATSASYGDVLEDLAAALVLWRRAEAADGNGARSRNPLPCRCRCGRRIRVSARTLEEAPITCGRCRQAFTPIDA